MKSMSITIVSIVVPFWGYLIKILNVYLVKPKKGTTMETIGSVGAENEKPETILDPTRLGGSISWTKAQ